MWDRHGVKLCDILSDWRHQKEIAVPGLLWARSQRPPPAHLKGGLVAVLRGHQDAVRSIAVSSDGRQVASGSSDKTARVWDVASRAAPKILRGHEGPVNSVVFSPDGLRVATGSDDETVRVWDAENATEMAVLHGHAGSVTSVAFSPDGAFLVTGSRDRTIYAWSIANRYDRIRLPLDVTEVLSVGFCAYGVQLVTVEECGIITLWNWKDIWTCPQMIHRIFGAHESILRVAWSCRGTQLAFSSQPVYRIGPVLTDMDVAHFKRSEIDRLVADQGIVREEPGPITLMDLVSGHPQATMKGHKQPVTALAVSPKGDRIVSGSYDRTLRVWDATNGEELAVVAAGDCIAASIESAAFLPDGKHIVIGDSDGMIQIFETVNRLERRQLVNCDANIFRVAFSPTGRRIVIWQWNDVVRIWEALTGEMVGAWPSCDRWSDKNVAFSPNDELIAVGSITAIRVWDTGRREEIAAFELAQGGWLGAPQATSLAFAQDGLRIASGQTGGVIKVWDLQNRTQVGWLFGHFGRVNCVTFSPDGRRIASGGYDRTARVWDWRDCAELACFAGKSEFCAIVFSPDGTRVATAECGRETVHIWDAVTGAELAKVSTDGSAVTTLAFAPGGTQLLGGCGGKKEVWVWNTDTGQPTEILKGWTNLASVVAGVVCSPQRLTGRGLETVIEQAADGKPAGWFPVPFPHTVTGPSGRTWAGWSTDHPYIITLEGECTP